MSTSGLHVRAPIYLVALSLAAITTTAMADKEGSTYRGKAHCSDSAVLSIVTGKDRCLWDPKFDMSDCYLKYRTKVREDSFEAEGGASAKVQSDYGLPYTPREATGKLGVGRTSVWLSGWKWVGDDPTGPYKEVVIEKTGAGSAAVNVLVCSFYDQAGSKLAKENAVRIPSDAPKGTKITLPITDETSRIFFHLVNIASESWIRTFPYRVSMPMPKKQATTQPAK